MTVKRKRKRRIKLSAEAAAQLLILNAFRFGQEKGRETTRFRYTRETLRKLSGWKRLSAPFLDDLAEEMLALGWNQMQVSDTEFGAIKADKVGAWPRIGPKRVADILRDMSPEQKIADEYDEQFPDDDDDLLIED